MPLQIGVKSVQGAPATNGLINTPYFSQEQSLLAKTA